MSERLAVSRRAALGRADTRASFADGHAGLGARLLAYLLDSLALFFFASAVAAIAFGNILLHSDAGRNSASDSAIWTSAVVLIATVPAWAALNLLLTAARGQTLGQYIVGLRLLREDGGDPGLPRLIVYWLALHPLLFHPLLAGFWILLAWVSISLSDGVAVAIVATAVALLCLAAPFASFLTALTDPERRGIHDRVAGIVVARVD